MNEASKTVNLRVASDEQSATYVRVQVATDAQHLELATQILKNYVPVLPVDHEADRLMAQMMSELPPAKTVTLHVPATVKLRVYPAIENAVGVAVIQGWMRAHKHTDTPTEDAIKESICTAVMLNLGELLDLGD